MAAAFAHAPWPSPRNVTGAGASFPAPLYAKWAADFNKATGAKINYQSVGSGAGIKQIDAKTVDFGASDMPLKDDELAKKGLMQFPTVIGGVVPVVNIKGIKPGPTQAQRPGARRHLPGQDHQVERPGDQGAEPLAARCRTPPSPPVRRADGSGTTLPVHQLPEQGQPRLEEPRSATARP